MKKSFLKKVALTTTILSSSAFGVNVSAQSITVQSGDTLWKLAQKHDISTNTLIETNNLSSTVLRVGQSLTIPNNTYTVQNGDSLWKVGQKFNVSVQDIMDWNQLSSTYLYPGQTLQLKEQPNYLANHMIETAKQYLGIPYQWGGDYPSEGFDCSGFLKFVFDKHDVTIPRTVATIYNEGSWVTEPKRGDVVFFETYKAGPSHAGIYLGDGQFVHASSSRGVTISSMNNVYWEPRYLGAKSYY